MYPIALVRRMVVHFADVAGFEDHVLVTFDKARFDRACRRLRLDPADDDDYGECITDPSRPIVPMVWVNEPQNKTVARLSRTCAHEALHIAQPTLPHGPVFDRGVRALLAGREP